MLDLALVTNPQHPVTHAQLTGNGPQLFLDVVEKTAPSSRDIIRLHGGFVVLFFPPQDRTANLLLPALCLSIAIINQSGVTS